MAAPEPRQIEWDSAQMHDGALTVGLTGTSSKPWSTRFEGVLALLDTPHKNWGDVKVTKRAVKVADVQPGSESELRHFLESVVLQANSDTAPGPAEQGLDSEAGGEDEHHSDPDEQMAAAFRSFADD